MYIAKVQDPALKRLHTRMLWLKSETFFMKYIKQFAIIISVSFIGEILAYLIPLPVPASIWGLGLMLLLLMLRIVPLNAVKETAKFLISLMQIMFIPAAVGLLSSVEALKNAWLPIVISILIVTPVVFFASGKTTDILIQHTKKNSEKGEKMHDRSHL